MRREDGPGDGIGYSQNPQKKMLGTDLSIEQAIGFFDHRGEHHLSGGAERDFD